MVSEYRICARCIMDSSDPDIVFYEQGICNHCHDHDRLVAQKVVTGEAGSKYLQKLVEEMQRAGRGKPYDCIIGVSGGVDSTYVAYLVKKLGLRPLAVHMDNGWDSELAVKNIEEALKRLGIELYTEVLDWEEFKSLQAAFLKASTPDSEIPSDHAIWAVLGNMADKLKVKYIVSGFNVRTETHLPRAWTYAVGRGMGVFGRAPPKHPHFYTQLRNFYPYFDNVFRIAICGTEYGSCQSWANRNNRFHFLLLKSFSLRID